MWQRLEKQLEDRLPFVAYRKPKQTAVYLVLQNDNALEEVFDFSETGFVFAPFTSDSAPVLIREDERLSAKFTHEAQSFDTIGRDSYADSGREKYLATLQKTIGEIGNGHFKKVVLSRFLEVENSFGAIALFRRILSTYKNAFCYLWFHPAIGMWFGATPEILLELNSKSLTTMSLAGTRKFEENKIAAWGKKELDEQKLVTDYILSELQDKVEDLQKSELQTIRAGELWHLRTKITGVLKENRLQHIIEALHPTPAVCGFPKKETMQYIVANEGYDRQYYAGYLGELNLGVENSTTLYVNLRCMQKIGNLMRIYVGGGVTKDSDPEKEWQETVNKSRTMLKVLMP